MTTMTTTTTTILFMIGSIVCINLFYFRPKQLQFVGLDASSFIYEEASIYNNSEIVNEPMGLLSSFQKREELNLPSQIIADNKSRSSSSTSNNNTFISPRIEYMEDEGILWQRKLVENPNTYLPRAFTNKKVSSWDERTISTTKTTTTTTATAIKLSSHPHDDRCGQTCGKGRCIRWPILG
jgi:hypothetical protein